MNRIRLVLGAIALWVVVGLTWLALSPAPARADHCMQAVCVDQFSCMFSAGKNCTIYASYCFSQMCWKDE